MNFGRIGLRIQAGYRALGHYEQPGSETCESPRARRKTRARKLERWSEYYRQERRLMEIAAVHGHDWVWDTDTPTVYCSRCEVVLESNGQELNPSELCEVK